MPGCRKRKATYGDSFLSLATDNGRASEGGVLRHSADALAPTLNFRYSPRISTRRGGTKAGACVVTSAVANQAAVSKDRVRSIIHANGWGAIPKAYS